MHIIGFGDLGPDAIGLARLCVVALRIACGSQTGYGTCFMLLASLNVLTDRAGRQYITHDTDAQTFFTIFLLLHHCMLRQGAQAFCSYNFDLCFAFASLLLRF